MRVAQRRLKGGSSLVYSSWLPKLDLNHGVVISCTIFRIPACWSVGIPSFKIVYKVKSICYRLPFCLPFLPPSPFPSSESTSPLPFCPFFFPPPVPLGGAFGSARAWPVAFTCTNNLLRLGNISPQTLHRYTRIRKKIKSNGENITTLTSSVDVAAAVVDSASRAFLRASRARRLSFFDISGSGVVGTVGWGVAS